MPIHSGSMAEAIRDAPIGQIIRWITSNRYLQYPEEEPGFRLPEPWLELLNNPDAHGGGSDSAESAACNEHTGEKFPSPARPDIEQPAPQVAFRGGRDASAHRVSSSAAAATGPAVSGSASDEPDPEPLRPQFSQTETTGFTQERLDADEMHELSKTRSIPIAPRRSKTGAILVDWYYTDDAANPHNWTDGRRLGIAVLICLYTFVVYTSSAIYTSSEPGVQRVFHVTDLEASLGLAMYVLGYGVGPLVFSPLSEVPLIGRNPVYIATMFLFVVLSIPTAFVGNFPGLVVLRFLQGFFGSPCLASGGASLGDLYSLMSLPYAMMAWVGAAYCGPALGPLLSGFAVPAESWRWSLFESLWASAPVFVLMFLFLPETSTPNILLRRARRLRKLTGDMRFMSQSEINQRNLKLSEVFWDALIKPLEITIKDPAVLFVQVYTAIIYAIYYSFFEVFPLVYPVYYGMNLGQVGLVFLCVLVSCILGIIVYTAYTYFYMNPRTWRLGLPVQESRLVPALPATLGPTVGLFLFAWTARKTVHWIVPTIGITIYGSAVFVVMQCIFIYIPLSYPMYAASLFAANDFFRSALACASVIFAHPLFGNLGVDRGVSLLGGLSVIGIVGIWLLYYYGARLRALSKFAISPDAE